MASNKSDSSLNTDLYASLYGSNRKLKPERIKVYALYKKLNVNSQNIDNLVIASDDTNEVSISFNGQSDCKVFTFDKVFNNVFQNEDFECLAKCIVQDVIMGLNCFLPVYRLASPTITKPFNDSTSISDMDSITCFAENMLKELLQSTKKEKHRDSSLHASYFEVHDDRIIDLLTDCHEPKDFKVFEIPDQNCIAIPDLIEKPLVDEKDISELLLKQQFHDSFLCQASCCHSVLSVSLVKINVNCDGFEFIKVGKLIMVNFTKCRNNYLIDARENSEDWLLKFAENQEFLTSPKYKIFDVLRPAFGGNAKTSIFVTLSSVLYSLEKDLNILQFVSGAQKIMNYPEINLRLIIRNSLKEYSEEIQELQKDLNAVCNVPGVMLDSLAYRSHKNSISLEKETVKALSSYLSLLTETVNAKKQSVISFHAQSETLECEIKDIEKATESLNLEIEKLIIEKNAKQKVFEKADEILTMKQVKISNEFCLKKLKSELTKTYSYHEELAKNLLSLKSDVISISCAMGAEQTTLRSTLQLLMVDINNTLSDYQNLQEDLLKELNNLNDIDVLLSMWKQKTEHLLSTFLYFVDENNRNLNFIKPKMNPSLPLNSQNELLEKIRNNRSEKWKVLSYYFHKVQIFCDFSFKVLTEITYQLDAIQRCCKAEKKTIGTILCSSSNTFKKFVSDISMSLKLHQQYFEEEEEKLSGMTDMVCVHHKFKKNFDDNIADIKRSLFALKQMCLGHSDATTSKWNEIQKDFQKTSEKHEDLSEHLSMIQKEMPKYVDSLSQQKMNILECFPVNDKTENVESKLHQLLQTYKDMQAVITEAFDVHKKGTDKELLEVREFMNSQRAKIERYVDGLALKLKTRSRSFHEELRSLQQTTASSKDELKKSLDLLSSSLDTLPTIYNEYKSVSHFILEKSQRSFKIMPTVKEDKTDDMPDISYLILDNWKVPTSTPNILERKILNLSHEKEKLLSRIRSVVEQQKSQKLNTCDLEGREKKNCNISTMSLPNLNSQVKAYNRGKNFSKVPKKVG